MTHFEIKRAKRGRLKRNQWRAVVKADNGKVLFGSESYNNRSDADATVQLLIDKIQSGQYTVTD
jgi:uncharacterized protein YegP (UPF0339 family)